MTNVISYLESKKVTHKRRCLKINNSDRNKPAANKNNLYCFYKYFFVFKEKLNTGCTKLVYE